MYNSVDHFLAVSLPPPALNSPLMRGYGIRKVTSFNTINVNSYINGEL